MTTPLLSICIPTFNRSESLRLLLQNIRQEAVDVTEHIEVVICDNASEDDTEQVVDEFRQDLPIHYEKRPENLGLAANVAMTPNSAAGEFCWLIGDDDLFADGSISRVVNRLRTTPEIDGIVVGYAYENADERQAVITEGRTSGHRPVYGDFMTDGDRVWEDTIPVNDVTALLTALVSMVFRKSTWLEHWPIIESVTEDESLSSLAATFPHTVIWANMYAGRTIHFMPNPQVHFFVGDQQWIGKWPAILFDQTMQLSDHFLARGCRQSAVDFYREQILKHSVLFQELLCSTEPYVTAHRDIAAVCRRCAYLTAFWTMLDRVNWREVPFGMRLNAMRSVGVAGFRYPARVLRFLPRAAGLFR